MVFWMLLHLKITPVVDMQYQIESSRGLWFLPEIACFSDFCFCTLVAVNTIIESDYTRSGWNFNVDLHIMYDVSIVKQ